MDVGDDNKSLYSFAIAGSAGPTSGIANSIVLAFAKGFDITTNVEPANVILETPRLGEMGMPTLGPIKACVLADKVEVGYKTDSKEIVYITGVTMSIQIKDEFTYRGGMIVARSVPVNGSGFAEATSNGSIVFTHDGVIRSMIQGDNVSSVTSSVISQAIPTAAMVSNDGIAAVSCMSVADGEARWLGYKNGIYKLYQGQTPLTGIPGEKVTIKGHEFVCLAYGPFYARMI